MWDATMDLTYWGIIQDDAPEGTPSLKRDSSIQLDRDDLLDDAGIARIKARTKERFERFSMEQKGAQILIQLLQDTLGTEIHYDARAGILIVEKPDGGASVTVFGKMAATLDRLAKSRGLSHDDTLSLAHELLLQTTEVLDSGGTLELVDADGLTLRTWESVDEFNRFLDKRHWE
jgi:hypothetical protein